MTISCLVADPAWKFGDKLPGRGRGASKHYVCMTVDDICAMDVPTAGDKHSVLFLWRVAAMQPEALRVVKAWGYTVKSELVWQKLTATGLHHFGMGRYVRASHETCLIATRGSAMPAVRNMRSMFAATVGVHSEKPTAFYEIVREMYPHALRYEMFARVLRKGFIQLGNELGKIEASS